MGCGPEGAGSPASSASVGKMSTLSASCRVELPGAAIAGRDDEQRDAVGLLVVGVFGPDAEIAEVKPVIAPEHHERIRREREPVEFVDHPADLRIHETYAGIVAVDELTLQRGRKFGVRVLRHRFVGRDFTAAFVRHLGRSSGELLKLRHRQRRGIVQIPVFFRRGKRQVRAHEAGGDKKRRAILLATLFGGLQALHHFGRHAPVRIIFVPHVRGLEGGTARQAADAVELLVREQRLLAGQLPSVRARGVEVFDHLVLEMRHAERLRIAFVAVPDMEDLADRFRAIAALFREVLRQRHRIRQDPPQPASKSIKAGGRGMRAEHEREARRRADGLVAIGEVEAHPARGQPVQVRCPGGRITVATERGLQVVDQDEQHIRPRRRRRQPGRTQEGQHQGEAEQEGEQGAAHDRRFLGNGADRCGLQLESVNHLSKEHLAGDRLTLPPSPPSVSLCAVLSPRR